VFTACGIMNRRSCQQATSSYIIAQSNAPEDGRNYSPKHVDLIEISNKLLLLHLVGCLYNCILRFFIIFRRYQYYTLVPANSENIAIRLLK